MSFPFNVRVYGALVNCGRILLSDESYSGISFTKLPGGGLEFGEGTAECIVRELAEETGLKVEVVQHLYTTDFFQASAFNKDHQVISIYYQIEVVSAVLPDKIESLEEDQTFRWQKLDELSESDFTFPIDKQIVPLLKELN